MECGVDVEVGIEEEEMLLVLTELKGCGCGDLDGVAVLGLEIKNGVGSFGQSKLIDSWAAFEGVVAETAAEGVVAETAAEGVMA